MADTVEEEEVIDAEGTEIVLRPDNAPATLFRTDNPAEIVTRATEIADALSDVLKKKGLTNKISNKDYVRVEGWTLCGSMLGVFPIVEWTRKIEDGWEARAEARTKDGSVVGAAEAECLRSENRWKTADDYSIRSMAQTRAISKALRAPLGFIVALAGYEATPEEEMAPPEPKPFDPDTDLLPGAISGRDAKKHLAEALDGFDPTVDWQEFLSVITEFAFGKDSWRDLSAKDQKDFWRRLSNAAQWLRERTPPGDFPPVDESMIVAAFAFAYSEDVAEEIVPIPRKEPAPPPEKTSDAPEETSDSPLTAEQVAQIEEALADPANDVPFD